MEKIFRSFESLNAWLGKRMGFLAFFIAFAIVYEILVRHFLNRPTIWANESTIFAACIIYMLAGAWAVLEDRHVRIDLFYHRFSDRKRALIDCLTFPFFTLFVVIMLWASFHYAWESFQVGETTSSPWNPPIYPMKMVMTVGLLLILLQGTIRFIRNLSLLWKKKSDPDHVH
jgi:TRAP-type mannitol/chloroaromatic compound transport system permease small subunit